MNVQAFRHDAASSPRVAVIGGGMSGILMGVKLREAGVRDYVIFEKARELGGTWRENTYPGIACDVAAHHYCYSFEPNPDWSRRHPPGAEINAYLKRVAEKYGVLPHVRFNTEVVSAAWDGAAWRLRTACGQEHVAEIVVSAAGVLHHPAYPDIPGLESFKGAMFHTARWDHGVDLAGKRVGIIGTGSTAAQIVPAIVDRVKTLTLFQRTPQWVHPMADKPYTAGEKLWFRRVPVLMKILYQWYYFMLERGFSRAVVGDKQAHEGLEKRCRDNLATVRDPVLRAKLTPDYKPGCKRLIFSSEFYPAIQKPNAELVTEGIDRIAPDGVITRDGKLHALDVLVLSTGFKADAFMRPMQMTGAGGVTMEQVWQDGPSAYRAVAVPQMPNFFMLIGPYSPVGNLSLISIAEWQAKYVMACIETIRTRRVAMAPRADVTARRLAEMRAAAANTVWVSGCKSWYLDKEGVPGLYPWEPSRFYREMRDAPDLADFELAPLLSPVKAAAE